MNRRSLFACLLVVFCVLGGVSDAQARAIRTGQIPNGNRASCLACHVSSSSSPGFPRNAFGTQIETGFLTVAGFSGSVVWGPALAALDADGDGYTNGEELGDPAGAWRVGDANPTLVVATLPGYGSCGSLSGTGAACSRCGGSSAGTQNCPTPCGDGAIYTAAGEVCDGSSLGGESCVTQGFDGGSLSCNASCSGVVTSGCTTAPPDICGDGVRTGAESCDGTDLGGSSCVSEGFDGGTLSCNASCSGLVTSACTTLPPQVCGDGVRTGTEVCDGVDLAGESCTTRGFDGGTLSCNASCSGLVTTGCTNVPPPACGDGIRTGTEACDTSDLGGQSCVSRGYTAGLLLCGADCNFDEVFCNQCGDGVVSGSEACDGSDLGGATCVSQGYAGGTLGCNGCGIDTSGCTLCGNGTRDGSETCDGSDLGGTSCEMLGFTGGTLGCGSGCVFDTGGCVGTPVDVCGDGVATGRELCDNSDLNGGSCGGLGFVDGPLGCAPDCTFDTAACSRCGDGVLDADESCDGAVPDFSTCVSEGFAAGTLGCSADCTFDVSSCTLCGNGEVDPGEACDGSDFGTATCASLGLDEGSLACSAGCTIDTSGCVPVPTERCGDGVAAGEESCDGDDLLGLSCDALGFASGDLACTADCTLNTANCELPEEDTAVDAGADAGDDATASDTGDDTAVAPGKKAKSDEGCSAGGNGGWSLLGLLAMLALARRRRSAR